MATIARVALESSESAPDAWPALARQIGQWADSHAVELRDAVLLLPFTQLLPLARAAFARGDGWSPRIETTRTLAASLGPAAPAERGQITHDAAVDALTAAQLLRSQAWGAAWAGRDPRGFEQAVDQVVATSHEIARAAAAIAPAERPSYWARARDLLAPVAGPGATARMLARVALEWASLAPAPPTDRLFALRPSAWIVVQAGGAEPLALRLLGDAHGPALLVDADAPAERPFAGLAKTTSPVLAVCDDFEHEAVSTAATVLEHLCRGEQPVALIAQDRALVRRVRALLERQQVGVVDETGWKLSTTRAAAQVMALLGAARRDARIDAVFDWLRSGTLWSAPAHTRALAELESTCREQQVTSLAALGRARLEGLPERLRGDVGVVLQELALPGRQPLQRWLAALAAALQRCGSLPLLAADEAGRQVLVALRLDAAQAGAAAWVATASAIAMSFTEFSTWVDRVLEQESFRPPPAANAQLVIVPLARAMLRPFGAIVFPGADDKHLGAHAAPHALLGEAQLLALGLPDAAQRGSAEEKAFGQALRTPRITFLRRRADATEPLAASPLIERLALALSHEGRALMPWPEPGHEVLIEPTPIFLSAPAAPGLLPEHLSASACEALRACPYRFFALNLLRLREEDELDGEVEKRDYGTWLHHVLHVFHRDRPAPAGAAEDLARLHAVALEAQAAEGLDEAEFLPFAASFAAFAPRYVDWLHEREALGARWLRGETGIEITPPAFEGTVLRGVIDRIDVVPSEQGEAQQLIDYKTGHISGLRDKVNEPLEDTQLAFYAALARSQTTLPLRAVYLAVDGTNAIETAEHKNVEATASILLEGLAHDLSRLRAGAGMPALGEGATCEHCDARGVCRRDHWSPPGPGA